MLARRSYFSRWHSPAAALSWRGFFYKFSFILLIILALVLIVVSRTQPVAVSYMRSQALDLVAPFLDALSRPALFVDRINGSLRDVLYLHADNMRLRQENARMIEWRNAVVSLEKENRELRALLNFKSEPSATYISARVIADVGGAYTRGLVVTAGRSDGVHEGMAAVTGDGLVGRVIEVGEWSSRIWLISDLNSRIPVVLAETGDRAILAGDNTASPKLLFLSREAGALEGHHVITSGHGGVFPPNLPIGTLKENNGSFSVVPSADLGRITHVRLVDFKLEGGEFNAIQKSIRSESKKR